MRRRRMEVRGRWRVWCRGRGRGGRGETRGEVVCWMLDVWNDELGIRNSYTIMRMVTTHR